MCSIFYVFWNFKMDHTSCKQKSDSSVIFWMTGICQFSFFPRRLFFMRRPSKKTLKEIFSLSVYTILWTTSYFKPRTFFSIYPQRTVRNIQCVLQKEMKHFDIWRRMKQVWSLRPQWNDIKTGFLHVNI